MPKRKNIVIILLVLAIISASFLYIDYSGLIMCRSKGVYSSLTRDYDASLLNKNALSRDYILADFEALSFTSRRYKNYNVEFYPPQDNPVMGKHTDWKIHLFTGCALQDRIIKKRFEHILTDFNVEKDWLNDVKFQKQRKSFFHL